MPHRTDTPRVHACLWDRSRYCARDLSPETKMRTSYVISLVLLASCSSMYYGTMEKFGYHKRDLLVERVQEGRKEQVDAQKQFQSTFDAFKALTEFEGGQLEATYKKLNSEYERCKSSAAAVTSRIKSIEKVAGDMFTEWKKENEQYQSADMRAKSEKMLDDTKVRYEGLITAMHGAETKMAPVLGAFGDQVLMLKHSLNAQAIASLQDTVVKIESDVGNLIKEMEKSIAEADSFIASMSEPKA
ncbi:MAG: DUF2959 domain-containing protein [Planctomycetota bacterium]